MPVSESVCVYLSRWVCYRSSNIPAPERAEASSVGENWFIRAGSWAHKRVCLRVSQPQKSSSLIFIQTVLVLERPLELLLNLPRD